MTTFLNSSLPSILTSSYCKWDDLLKGKKLCLTAEGAEIPNTMIRVAVDMLNCEEDSQSSVAIIHDANDGEMDFDFSPIEYNESERQNMIVLVVNKPGSGETFTEDRLRAAKDLLGNWSINPDWKFKFTRRGRAQGSTFVSIKSAQGRQLTQARLNAFLDFLQSIQYVVIYKVNGLDEVNKFLAPFMPLSVSNNMRNSVPSDWKYVRIHAFTKYFYHTGDIDAASLAAAHYVGILNLHHLLSTVSAPRSIGRPKNDTHYLLRDIVVPTTVSGWRMKMQQRLNASSSQSSRWTQFLYERVCVDIEGEQKQGVVVHGGYENAVPRADGGRKLYYFVVRVASSGNVEQDIDVQMNEVEFSLQWAKLAMNGNTGKIDDVHRGRYVYSAGTSSI